MGHDAANTGIYAHSVHCDGDSWPRRAERRSQGAEGFSTQEWVFMEWSEMVSWRCSRAMRKDHLCEILEKEFHAEGTFNDHEAETNVACREQWERSWGHTGHLTPAHPCRKSPSPDLPLVLWKASS